MRIPDRLRAVPPQWYAVGAAAIAIILIAALIVGRSNDGLATANPNATEQATTTQPSTVAPTRQASSTTSSIPATTTSGPTVTGSTIDISAKYHFLIDEKNPAVVSRPIPVDPDPGQPPPNTIAPPPWAASTRSTEGGYLGTDVGCAKDRSVASLDAFFAARVGPVLGWDYQHVYPLGGDRYLWLFQDAFVDHSGGASTLTNARFLHNAALVQTGSCFSLLHRGTAGRPKPFENGDSDPADRSTWYWPMGGETADGQLWVFWAEMVKDPYNPDPPDGLGWHPNRVFLASYDTQTLRRTAFVPAPDAGANPIYGYAVSSDATYTYLFGNTFEQNLVREGGFWSGQHSATAMWLARVPKGQLTLRPEYRTGDGWSPNRVDAVPIVKRFYTENPMQPRYLDGQWVSATDVDGYWGDSLAIDVAPQPWGPWSTVQYGPMLPRNGDPKMNTYHAHLLPWRDKFGSLQVIVSNNARNMVRDAYPYPYRYRPQVFYVPYAPTPPPPSTTSTSTTSTSTTSTSTTSTSTTSTTTPSTSSTSTTTSTSTSTPTSTPTSTTTSTTTMP